MQIAQKIKKVVFYIVIAVFWIGVAATFIGGCAGMLFHSGDEQTYEEHFLDKVP
jgi:hypothetical protein